MRCFSSPTGKFFSEIKSVGAGAQGSAILVRDRDNGQFVLKEVVMRQWSKECRDEALKEVHAMQVTCKHPNIIMYYDSWFEHNKLHILMEFAPNGSLDSIIEAYKKTNNYFTQNQVIHYMEQLTSALEYCHSHLKIIHRDIKPGNILVDQLGNLKLGDFGLSKDLNKNLMCATYVGSPLYMAPEILKGYEYTFSVDIWALGCVIYEIMALKSPWDTVEAKPVTHFAALVDIIINRFPRFDFLLERYTQNLVMIIKWMINKVPERRATASNLNDHFQIRPPPAEWQVSIVPTPTPPPPPQVFRQQQLIQDARRLVDAASLIQKSFRESQNGGRYRPQKVYDSQRRRYPNTPPNSKPVPVAKPIQVPRRPVAVPKRLPPTLQPLPAQDRPRYVVNRADVAKQAPPIRPNHLPSLQVQNSQDATVKIQQAFRSSLNRRRPPSTQKYSPISDRLQKLATPRPRQVHPELGTHHRPRQAWI